MQRAPPAAAPAAPTTIVAIDFGTAATGYCISQAPPAGAPITSARVFPFKPGDRGAAATEKNLTAVLLTADAAMSVVAFGREARRRFHEMEEAEQRGYLYLETFKMLMAPSRRGKVPLMRRTVHALGADVAVPLLTATAKVLEAVAVEAKDRLQSLGVRPGTEGWVVTIPAIWDDEAKSFMREAAVRAGMVPDTSAGAARLLLCLEPEGAVIASLLETSADVQRRFKVGTSIMILDCGGGTVDVTVSEVTQTEPYALKEILPASGDAWGGTLVDAEARKFFNALLAPSGAAPGGQRADPSSLAAIMDSWETAKAQWDPDDINRGTAKVTGLASICEAIGGADVMGERVAAFNREHALEGASAVAYRPRTFALWLPPALVRSFFDVCVKSICAHMLLLFEEADALGHQIGFVFLVGGFAESLYLQRAVRAALSLQAPNGADGPLYLAELIVPHKPVQVVNRGSALWGLYPASFITSRVSKYTYAVDLAEGYTPAVHDPLPSQSYLETSLRGFVYCKHVLVPLVQRGDVLPIDFHVKREVEPLVSVQTKTCFDLYRLDVRLPPFLDNVRRVLVLEDTLPTPSEAARTLARPAAATPAAPPSAPAAVGAGRPRGSGRQRLFHRPQPGAGLFRADFGAEAAAAP